jgi:hypothetical protein
MGRTHPSGSRRTVPALDSQASRTALARQSRVCASTVANVRELLSWRLVAALAALAGLAFVASSALSDDDALQAVVDPTPVERRIDLISPVIAPLPSDDFAVGDDGRTVGYLDLLLPGERTMRVAPGTLGEVSCEVLDEFNRCGVLADVLGDAVVWFALVPQQARATAELPPIVDLEEGYAVFENGWRIAYPPVIERECGDLDIPTFSDSLERHGPGSVSIVDLNTQEVTAVRCGDPDAN